MTKRLSKYKRRNKRRSRRRSIYRRRRSKYRKRSKSRRSRRSKSRHIRRGKRNSALQFGLAFGLGMGVPLTIGGIGYRVYKKKEDKRREMNIKAAIKTAQIYKLADPNNVILNQRSNIVTDNYKNLTTKLKWMKFVDPTWNLPFSNEMWRLFLKESIPRKIGRKLTSDELYALQNLPDK